MSNAIDLIGAKTYTVGDIIINIPTVRQLRGDNNKDNTQYWKDFGLFMKVPDEMSSELDDIGIDFSQMSDYDLFMLLFLIHKKFTADETVSVDSCRLFENLNLYDLELQNDTFVDKEGKTIIDRNIYRQISDVLCAIICYQKPKKMKWGNDFARKMWIKRDREKKEKQRKEAILQKENGTENENSHSLIGGVILRLVNSGRFPYNYETVKDITIYELFWSLRQIDRDNEVDYLMNTSLVGNDLSKIAQSRLSRFVM